MWNIRDNPGAAHITSGAAVTQIPRFAVSIAAVFARFSRYINMQSSSSTAFLCSDSKAVLLARPWFLRRLSLKDGSIDMFEIDCLTKHIAKFAEPTDEQRTRLKVLTELKSVLKTLSVNGKAIPLMKELLKLEPPAFSRNAPPVSKQAVKPNSPAPGLNRRASDARLSTGKTAAAPLPASAGVQKAPATGRLPKPPVSNGLPKPATASSQPAAAPRTTVGQPVPPRIERSAASSAPPAVPAAHSAQPARKSGHPMVSHFLNKLGESANSSSANPAKEKPKSKPAAPALPLSAALASHQCSIR